MPYLRKNPCVFEEYEKVIRTQLNEGILEDIDENRPVEVGKVYYLPHREVIREKKETTKLRIVCDASSKVKGPSLNNCLETGPCLLAKIFDILIRFRSYKYGIISDIKSAFLNIRILERYRDFLRFLWVDDIKKDNPEVVVKRFTSVLFGLNCSPFLLGATITVHMEKFCDVNPELIMRFLNDLYRDDRVSGVQELQEGYDFYLYIKIFMRGGFSLRKWVTNDSELRE